MAMPFFAGNSGNGPGTLNDDLLIRDVLAASIKRSPKGRVQIAEDMSRYLGVRVTETMLACFTAECKKLHRWPAAWDRAFCKAVEDETLLRCRAEAAGYRLIRGEEIQLLELGRQYLKQKRASEQVEALEATLREAQL